MKGALFSNEVAEPYAQALMSVAQSNDLADRFGEDLRSLLALWEDSQALREFIANPVVQESDKKAVLERIVGDETDPYLKNFLMLLVDKGRIVFLEEVCNQYLELLRQLNNTVLAEVTSAIALDEAQQEAIAEKVKSMSGAQSVELKTAVERDLIGGVIIKVGSQVLDASLRGQLRRIGFSLGRTT